MAKTISALLASIRSNPKDVRFSDAVRVSEAYFGPYRQSGSSHCVFKMQWPGDPRINLQEGKNGRAKPYQVNQMLQAIDKLDALNKQRKE